MPLRSVKTANKFDDNNPLKNTIKKEERTNVITMPTTPLPIGLLFFGQ